MQGKEAIRPMQPPAPVAGDRPLRLLVSVPALDEQETVADVVRRVPRDIPGVGSVEVVVVDDGSRDETATRAAEAGAQILHHRRTHGVGAAFHTAIAYAIERGVDLLVSIDADGQFDPADIPALVRPVVDGEADFSSASRFMDPSLVPDMPTIKLWGNRMMSRLISSLAGETFYDVSCGMRCYDRKAFLQLHLLARFTYTQEVFLNLSFKKLRIVEVPIRVRGEREFGESRVAGSLWRYGVRTVQIIFRCYRDYHPLRFFGGIALGLMVPAAGLAVFLAWHYLSTGSFSPHKWAGFSVVALVSLALLVAQIGIIGDMLNRHRVYLEELLYRQRSGAWGEREER
jgi:glycosyltransferase involved in cell wall biosynthesis